jgi:hypothetical protein
VLGAHTRLNLATNSKSVTTASIHRYYKRCERTIEAYSDGMAYGTEEFTERVYKGHRQVADKSKW